MNALVAVYYMRDARQRDLTANRKEIDALLSRNHEQAIALEFQGTPAFIIGKFRVPGALDEANFKRAIVDSRATAKRRYIGRR